VLRTPLLLLLCKALVCALVACRTGVPGLDGVSYLWMAQETAAGRPEALFATVFHPLYPALVATLLRAMPALDPELAGQLVACSCATLAILPLWATAVASFDRRIATWTCICYAVGAWFARNPAECLSEGPFFLLVALWAYALTRVRPHAALAGAFGALAYLCRPEGAALIAIGAVWLWGRRERARALELLLGALPLAALLPAGYAALGPGFTLTPKASFNWTVGAGSEEHGGIALLLKNVAELPLSSCEEIGFLVFPLVVVGLVLQRPGRWRDPRWLLLAPFLAQCCAVVLVRSHHRFLAGYGMLLLPFAGVTLAWCWQSLLRKDPRLPWLVPLLLLASESRVVAERNQDREIERQLGLYLGPQLLPGETLASDMPRVVYYAGRRPPEPKPITPAEILAAAVRPECRFVALSLTRRDRLADEVAGLGLEPVELPALLSARAGRHSVQVYANPRHR
jgi:hypothetical protein